MRKPKYEGEGTTFTLYLPERLEQRVEDSRQENLQGSRNLEGSEGQKAEGRQQENLQGLEGQEAEEAFRIEEILQRILGNIF